MTTVAGDVLESVLMSMRAALVVESLTGHTWKAAELIADGLTQHGWTITGLSKVKNPDHASIQDADLVLVGTWVHGLFVVGQTPWAVSNISNLPAMRNKRAAVFCTFALNPGRSLDRLTGAVEATGAGVIGGWPSTVPSSRPTAKRSASACWASSAASEPPPPSSAFAVLNPIVLTRRSSWSCRRPRRRR